MSSTPSTPTGDRATTWRRVALALLGGIVVESVLVFFAAGNQYPIPPPPVRAAPVFVWTATLAVPAFLLLYWNEVVGYPAAVLAGLVVLAGVGLVGAGSFGPLSSSTNPVGPALFALLGAGVVVSSLLAWRARPAVASADVARTAVL